MSLPKIFVCTLLLIGSFFLGRPVAAQEPIPPPPVDCEDTATPEFHSLRPYQASPCKKNPDNLAQFCGNRLVLTDRVSATRTIPPKRDPECQFIGNNLYRCHYKIFGKTQSYSLELSGANLPILGNTEKVRNSQTQNEELDDAEKTNEYVSWYLSGVSWKPEYGEGSSGTVVNFSGPVNKLLPWDILAQARIETIKRAGLDRHNQIVAPDGTRLKDWEGQISPAFLSIPARIYDFIFPDWLVVFGDPWNKKIPPLASDFEDNLEYQKAYHEWRGKSCAIIMNRRSLLCIDNPLRPNKWANLFPYIPLSSTEDRVGLVSVDSQKISAASEGLEITNVSLTTSLARLYFAHTEENNELANLLQLTFVPQGNATTGEESFVSQTEDCYLTNIRSNEGDNLFAENITGNLSYDASFSCDFPATASFSACTKDVSVGLSVVTKTPVADELWSRLVAGPAGIFKRIFPKVGAGGAILGLLDMPAATKVSYSGSGLVSAGNPGARAGQSAELYFPHIGGVSEYFLKGIQTILRPKGFGEQIISGTEGTFPSSGEVNCDQNAPDVSLARTINKQNYFQLALNWVGGQTGTHALECYNDTVRRAQAAGINVPLTLWIWLHESDASNYNISVQDFGAAYPAPVGYLDQINEFFRRAKIYNSQNSLCAGRDVTDMQAFAYLYQTGTCDPNAQGGKAAEYYDSLVKQWSWISNCPLPSSPTDTSCQ